MKNRNTILLIIILILSLIVLFIDLSNRGLSFELGPISMDQDFSIKQGLDLQGGLQVLLEADLPPGEDPEPGSLDVSAQIIGNRVNALGVVEPLVQTQGSRRIIIELPGVEDPEQAVATIKETGLLEFIDAGEFFVPPGTAVQTTYPLLESQGATTELVEAGLIPPEAPITGTQESETPTTEGEAPTGPAITDRVFATVLTGAHLEAAAVQRDEQTGQCESTCTPDCTGRECGDDGCGGSCGTCSGAEICNVTGQCVPV